MTPPLLTCDAYDALLPDLLEGTLDADARQRADAHAATCARCGALTAELQALTVEAAALPELTPSRDLWAGIATRIAAPVVALPTPVARPIWRRQWAAAAALVVVTAGVTWTVARPGSGRRSRGVEMAAGNDSAATLAVTPGVPRAPRGLAVSRPTAVQTYASEVEVLEQALRDRREQLDPKTAAVITANLQIIDKAIRDAKAALATDPNSAFLEEQFTTVLGKKLELLRRAAMLPART